MKKIGLITISGVGCNYGGKLQNYALQTIVERFGFKVETIQDVRFCPNPLSLLTYKKAVIHYLTRLKYNAERHRKPLAFYFWKKKYIHYSPIFIHSIKDEQKLLKRYQGYIVGSDQIWGPLCPWDSNELSFLEFAPRNQRIAYAPSFGSSVMPDERRADYVRWLSGFDTLSVREHAGADIIKELTGKEAMVHIDPTMLLTTEDYDKIAIAGPKKKYVLVYTLGNLTAEYQEYLNNVINENDWEIVDMMREDKYSGGHPGNFIGLIRDAEMVFTDSFHGSVFSLLYHRRLVIVDRAGYNVDMSSRMDTLKAKFNLQNEIIGNVGELTIDWEYVEDVLKLEREVSISYLKKELGKLAR